MKTLLIMRHAKSSRDDPNLDDRDRPLNDRGRRDAPRMGQRLADAGLVPGRILASSAVRARETAEAVAAACGYRAQISYLDSLYASPSAAYLDALETLPESESSVLVIGHNPGAEDLVRLLTGQAVEMPTAAIAHVKLLVDGWRDIREQRLGELATVWRPKDS